MLGPVGEGTEVTGTAAAVGEREGHCEVSLEPHGNTAAGYGREQEERPGKGDPRRRCLRLAG